MTAHASARRGLLALCLAMTSLGLLALAPIHHHRGAVRVSSAGGLPHGSSVLDEPSSTVPADDASTTTSPPRNDTSARTTTTEDPDGPPILPSTSTTVFVPDPIVREFATGAEGLESGAIASGANHDLWFTVRGKGLDPGGKIGRITTTGVVTLYSVSGDPMAITLGSDGAMWFAYLNGGVGRLTDDGLLTENWSCCYYGFGITATPDGGFLIPDGNNRLYHVTTSFDPQLVYGLGFGGDNRVAPAFVDHRGTTWIPDLWGLLKPNVAPSGPVSYGATPIQLMTGQAPLLLTQLADDAIWFTYTDNSDGITQRIGRVLPPASFENYFAVTATSFDIPDPWPITAIVGGPDGYIWFAQHDRIGRMSPAGKIRWFAVQSPSGLAVGPDRNIWFSQINGRVGRIDLSQL